MRRITLITLLLLASAAGTSGAAGIGLGVFGGRSFPVVNDLSTAGSQFGLRVPVSVIPMLTLEPVYESTSLGDLTSDFGTGTTYTRDGGKNHGYGLNAQFSFGAPGFRMFPYAGIGSYTIRRSGDPDLSEAGYNLGFGVGFSVIPKLSVDVRGELEMIRTGDTSRKYGNVTGGVTYQLFSLPGGGLP